jgi:X-Pro dipeptidyl-peptidase
MPYGQAQKANQETLAKTLPIIRDGEAQIVADFNKAKEWIKQDVWVETTIDSDRDGKPDRIHVFLTRPRQTETEGLKLPAIYIASPYYGGRPKQAKKMNWDVKHELGNPPKDRKHGKIKRKNKRPFYTGLFFDRTWVPRGYVMVYSSSVGTGFSDGVPTIGGENETHACTSVIDWLCNRTPAYSSRNGIEQVWASWCTGKIGMTGSSYNGTLALAAATTGIDGLEVIIPDAPNTSYYHYYRSNGLVRAPGNYQGEDLDVLFDFINSADDAQRAYGAKYIRDSILVPGMDRVTGDYNEFWAERDYLNQMDSMKCAMLMSHAFNDWNVMPEHSFRVYKKAREMGLTTHIYYHQGGHGGMPPFQMVNKWFTRFLFSYKNGVEKGEKAWIVREGAVNNSPVAYDDYPNPLASPVTLFPKKGKSRIGQLNAIKLPDQGIGSIIDDYTLAGKELIDSSNSLHRLLFVTPILKNDVHISGIPEIKISLSSSKPAANLSIWLVSLPWEKGHIYKNIITRGWADPQNHSSLSKSEPLVPGKFYDLSFDLMPDDQIIPKGQQIGLMIFSSDKEFTIWPEPGTELTIDLDKTSISIPVVGGFNAFNAAVKKY